MRESLQSIITDRDEAVASMAEREDENQALKRTNHELLKALEDLLEGIEQNVMISARMGGKRDAHERINKARAAIKAAKGE